MKFIKCHGVLYEGLIRLSVQKCTLSKQNPSCDWSSPVCRACCSFSRFSSWTMSWICFCRSATAASFGASDFKHKTFRIITLKVQRISESLFMFSMSCLHSSCKKRLPFFSGFFFSGFCWNEKWASSRRPSRTQTPLNSMVHRAEWSCSDVDARNLSPSHPPSHRRRFGNNRPTSGALREASLLAPDVSRGGQACRAGAEKPLHNSSAEIKTLSVAWTTLLKYASAVNVGRPEGKL